MSVDAYYAAWSGAKSLPDVIFNLICVSAAAYVYLVDTGIGEEFEGELDEWGIGQRQ